MATLFFDTSALVKYYHPEVGSSVIESLFAEKAGLITISTLGMLETQSAFAIKVRSGQIDCGEAGGPRLRLMLDIASGTIQTLALTPKHFSDAARLLSQYSYTVPLRTLDALQLAVASELHVEQSLELFVAVDQRSIDVARLEGLPVLDPRS